MRHLDAMGLPIKDQANMWKQPADGVRWPFLWAAYALTIGAFCLLAYAYSLTPARAAVLEPIPNAIVLVVCKTEPNGEPDQNAKFTGYENRRFVVEHGMMQCRRIELAVHGVDDVGNPSVGVPPVPSLSAVPFNRHRCQMGAMFVGARWDQQNKGQSYRVWKAACPVPIVDTRTGDVIAWKMPECGDRDTVICEVDTAI